ncbi:50S ribosomal protein L10 [Fundidesulfovibrio magnetotacticus]|uniref:Large ribosomal subunit protein uL10 n=1 Tax=Fundidesulfovibrio magnetotacticus TaxID=2730080 RepID=A0A6V8M668_9BACT|nr:50S ribosomal protein L10 [Fundidesulfovibrio magnetotacticus]GFK96115.1 50S ribosomal protein L10 [Fundidesulfovibrio magnetotacticus]
MQTREEKAEIIEKIKDRAGRASIAVVTDFKGLTVEEVTGLRVKLREAGVDFQVVKNTLARIALTGSPHDSIKERFKEQCAVAFGYDDPVACAKALVDYAKTNKKFSVRFASLQGQVIDEAGLKALSMLPSKPQLLAQVLGTMNAVPTNFVSVLANVMRGVLNVLTALKDKKEAA